MLARVVSPAVAPKVTSRVTRRAARNIVRAEEEDKSTAIMKVGREKTGLWFASEQSLSYLDGTLPGDFGFDPLGLSDPEGAGGFIDPKWLAYSEVIHCRYAMLGVAGCLAPEVLGQFGAIPEETGLVWFRTGVIPPAGTYDGYWPAPVAVFYVNMVLMQFAELRRLQDYNYPGSMGKQYFLGLEGALGGSGDPTYPGGPIFNFLNLGETPEKMNNLKLSEVKNGRLAMISIFGYGAQAVMTGKSPVENLADHIADPIHNNMLTNFATAFAQ